MEAEPDRLWRQAIGEYRAGNARAADATCRRLIALAPHAPMGYWMLSRLALARGRWREAEQFALAAAARLDRASWRDRLLVCRVLLEAGESEASATGLRELVAEGLPDAADAEAALLFSQLAVHDAAVQLAQRVRTRGYRDGFECDVCGVIFGFMGMMAPAREAFERSLAFKPGDGRAHWNSARFGAIEDAPRRIARVRSLLASGGVQRADAVFMHYALFMDLDALDRREEAWSALAIGAALQSAQLRYDAAAEAAEFALRRDTHAPGQAAGSSGLACGDESAVPIFILGQPRTGTTLVERHLAADPMLARCGELQDFPMQRRWVADAPGEPAALDQALLGRRYLDKTRWRWRGRRFFTDKLPLNLTHCGDILHSLPDARIVWMRRHPLDCAFSNLKLLFAPGALPHSYRFEDLAAHHRNVEVLMSHWRSQAEGRLLDVRYEQLATDPLATLARIRAHVGLPEPAAVDARAAAAMPEATASTVQVREPVSTRYVGGWTRYREHLRPLEALLAADIAAYEAG